MAIMVGENYKVGADKYNIIVYNKVADSAKSERMREMWKNKKSEEAQEKIDDDDKAEKGWKVAGYYSSVENALNSIVKLEILKTELKDLETVLNTINQTSKDIRESLSLLSSKVLQQSLNDGEGSSSCQENNDEK